MDDLTIGLVVGVVASPIILYVLLYVFYKLFLESIKEDFDEKVSMKEVRDMIGFYEPSDDVKKGSFEVTLIDGGYTVATET